jgi:DNA-directed RNA polymerase beta' subunit
MALYADLSYQSNKIEISEVKSLQFSIMSSSEIVKRSVGKITRNDISSDNAENLSNSLSSLKMGASQNALCSTCGLKNSLCCNHHAHIELAKPCFNICFHNIIRKILKCVCYRCSRILISPHTQHEDLKNDMAKIMAIKSNQKRFEAYFKLCNTTTKVKLCGDDKHIGCGSRQPDRYNKEAAMKIIAEWKDKDKEKNNSTQLEFTPEDVLRIFKRITNEDMEVMGFNPTWSKPEDMILQSLPVPPPAVRPSIIEENGQRREDDLTHKLSDIIKTNNNILDKINKGASEETIKLITMVLQYHVFTLMDNQIPGLAPSQQRNGRKLKSICDRMRKKDGRIRGNLNGKRVDQSARSVITPDPFISIDELGVPIKIALNITFQEVVNEYNIDEMKRLILNGPDNWPGAKYIRKVDNMVTINLKYADLNKIVNELKFGDVVHRHLRNGDYVLFNRQPSLHKMSMMCHKVIIMPYQTFRLNVLDTPPYNADFDGDEMNLHCPQNIQTMFELKDLASVPYLILTQKDGKPSIEVVQDTLVGSFRLTKDYTIVGDKQMANLQMCNSYFKGKLEKPSKDYTYTGKELFSEILPPALYIEEKNKAGEKVIIHNSKLIKGNLDKAVFHNITNGLIPVIYHDYGPVEIKKFLDNTQRLVCRWLLTAGFSIGISDLVTDKNTETELIGKIKEMKASAYKKLDDMRKGNLENNSIFNNEDFIERELIGILNETTSIVAKISLAKIDEKTNRMFNMVKSGSKGKETNIAQIMACVGQQNVDGKRIAYGFTDRTLPHFTKYDDGPEARGFVENSFIAGLSPHEVFFHAMGGREGLIDTAVKSVSGDTEIIIIQDGISRCVKIGEWIDTYLDDDKYKSSIEYSGKEELNLELLNIDEEILIATGDEKGKVNWSKITAITRHDPNEILYKIRTSGGREVVVPNSESLLIWNGEGFYKKKTDLIKIGECVPTIAILKRPQIINEFVRFNGIDYELDEELGRNMGLYISNEVLDNNLEFLEKFVGTDEKKFPDFIYNAPNKFINSLMKNIDKKEMNTKELILGYNTLNNFYGYYGIINEFSYNLGFNHRYNDVVFDVIEEIKELNEDEKKNYKKLYDLTIPDTYNFAIRNGLVLRDTSSTGYAQRKLVKAMEDAKINYDNSVRNANGTIIQFIYGEDGMDGCKIENQFLPTIEMSYMKMEEEYNLTPVDKIENYLTEDAKKDIKLETYKRCKNHFLRLIDDKMFMIIKVNNYNKNSKIKYPIPFNRIISTAIKRRDELGIVGTLTNLTPDYILDKIDMIIKDLYIKDVDDKNFMEDIFVDDMEYLEEFKNGKNFSKQSMMFFHILLRCYLSPKKMIIKNNFSKELFDWVVKQIYEYFYEALAPPSEMVGVVAAQTIGEMGTQMTLDSFHVSGTAAAVKATSGVPRLNEILSATKKTKTPTLIIHMKPDVASVVNPKISEDGVNYDDDRVNIETKDKAIKIKNSLEITRLADILETSEIYWDNGMGTRIEEDKKILEIYDKFRPLYEAVNKNHSRSNWVLRMKFNKEKIVANGLRMIDIYTRLNKIYNKYIDCVYSDDNAEECVFRVRLTEFACKDIENKDEIAAIKAMEHNIVYQVLLKGYKGINKVSLNKKKYEKFNKEKGDFDKIVEWVLDTDGTNLMEILANPNIDATRTISNDIREIYNVLGVEAARTALAIELTNVIGEGAMNYRHLSLLIDTMTFKGGLMSIDRHGINRNASSALSKSSFEESVDMLINASIFAEFDNMSGISPQVMLGKVANCGTGNFDIILDEEYMMELMKNTKMKKKNKYDVDEIIEEEDDEDCIAENIAFDFSIKNKDECYKINKQEIKIV